MKTEFRCYRELREFTESYCTLASKDSLERKQTIEEWQQQNLEVCGILDYQDKERGTVAHTICGQVQKIRDGLWGYGGDRYAVLISGGYVPSGTCHLA